MIARKSALIIATEILDAILAYVALFFITRYMDPGDYGILAFALGFVALFTIFGKFGFPKMGIKGAGIATVISVVVTSSLFLGLMFQKKYNKKFSTVSGWRFDRNLFRRLLRFGFPLFRFIGY